MSLLVLLEIVSTKNQDPDTDPGLFQKQIRIQSKQPVPDLHHCLLERGLAVSGRGEGGARYVQLSNLGFNTKVFFFITHYMGPMRVCKMFIIDT